MEEDSRLVIHAAANAQRAADWILGERVEATAQATTEMENTELVGGRAKTILDFRVKA